VFPTLLADPDATSVAESLHRFEVVGIDGRVVVYSSIIDNLTNDASYLVGQWTAQATATAWLPGAAEILGANDSQWRSDVVVMNPDSGPATVELAFHGTSQSGSSVPDMRPVALAARESRFEGDVLATLFGYAPPAVGSLESRAATGSPPLVWMRTYTEEVNGVGATVTYGQAVLPRATQTMVAPAQEGRIVGFSHGPTARANLILQNTRADSSGELLASDVRIDVLDAAGQLRHQRTYSLGPGEYLQHNRFIADYGLSEIDSGSLRVVLLDGASPGETGGVDAMVSEVNGNTLPGTNDGRLLRANVVPTGGR
jgi:hypothetical protein